MSDMSGTTSTTGSVGAAGIQQVYAGAGKKKPKGFRVKDNVSGRYFPDEFDDYEAAKKHAAENMGTVRRADEVEEERNGNPLFRDRRK